jgi:hypothetical protein
MLWCQVEGYKIAVADEFEYHDPVDGSVSSHQVRVYFLLEYLSPCTEMGKAPTETHGVPHHHHTEATTPASPARLYTIHSCAAFFP